MGSEMVERVAKAMEARRAELIAKPLARVWDELALAAMEAMREPTQAMILAAPASYSDSFQAIWPKVCGELWGKMLDAEIEAAKKGL